MRTEKSLETGNWKLEISPKRSLGQNFLINAGILEKITDASELNKNDTVLEIGPGTGNLTKLLSEKAGRVIAIEKDHRMVDFLKTELLTFSNHIGNVEIMEGDVLTSPRLNLVLQGLTLYKIVGNIPYYITSHLLKIIFEKWPRPELIVLTVQKEVAQRIVAKPPHMNLLALSVQFYSEPKLVGYISRGSFRPMPNVDSAIIRLVPRRELRIMNYESRERFFKLIKAGFSEKRKQLINNLVKNFGMMREDVLKVFEKMDIKYDIRAENLSLNQWIELSKLMKK